MRSTWQDFGLWLVGLVVMVAGALTPTYLFQSEGSDSLFGNIIYVLAGILLFLSGLGVTFFRAWSAERVKGIRPEAERTGA